MTSALASIFGAKECCIGDYTLLHTIGVGSSATVWLARHMPTGTEVAMKALSQCDLTRHFQEVSCLKSLSHPNIARLFEVIATEEKIYLFMEHVSGGDLVEYLENHGPRSEREVRRLFRQLMSAVHYCHQKGIVHRDLKPENVTSTFSVENDISQQEMGRLTFTLLEIKICKMLKRVDGERNIKLIDFGFAREFTNDKLSTYCGTVPYMAPEILKHHTYDGQKADVWSLGVVLYRMRVGELTFLGDTFGKMKKKILHGKVHVPRCVSKEGRTLLKRLLTPDPGRRPSLEDRLSDPWVNMRQAAELRPCSEPPWGDNDPQVMAVMKGMGFREEEIEESVTHRTYNRVMGTYLILKTTKAKMNCLSIRVRPCSSPDLKSKERTEEPAIPSSHSGLGTTIRPHGTESIPTTSAGLEERISVPPPSLAPRASTSLTTPESRTATPSPALQRGSGSSPTSSKSSRRTTGGTNPEVCLQPPMGGTPGSPSDHSQGRQTVAQRAFRFFRNLCSCCGPSTKKQRHKRTRVKPK